MCRVEAAVVYYSKTGIFLSPSLFLSLAAEKRLHSADSASPNTGSSDPPSVLLAPTTSVSSRCVASVSPPIPPIPPLPQPARKIRPASASVQTWPCVYNSNPLRTLSTGWTYVNRCRSAQKINQPGDLMWRRCRIGLSSPFVHARGSRSRSRSPGEPPTGWSVKKRARVWRQGGH